LAFFTSFDEKFTQNLPSLHFQGVPVLILANKQDLPGAKEPKELEKLLGLHELAPLCSAISLGQSSSGTMAGSGSSSSNQPQQTTNTTTTHTSSSTHSSKEIHKDKDNKDHHHHHAPLPSMKGYHIQPACAITGEGLQEGLEALYDMIVRKRKLTKANKKKR
jgi:ADP-ribosylation factor-like protein 4